MRGFRDIEDFGKDHRLPFAGHRLVPSAVIGAQILKSGL
jgi:hypothetical protein